MQLDIVTPCVLVVDHYVLQEGYHWLELGEVIDCFVIFVFEIAHIPRELVENVAEHASVLGVAS